MSEKNPLKKEVKAKHKSTPKKNMGGVQKNNKKKVSKQMLYLPISQFKWIELAYGASFPESITWCIPKIRFEDIAPSVLQLQHKPRRKRSKVLSRNVKKRRTRILKPNRKR